MTEITRVGLDLAKNVFQVHAVNAQEQVVVRRSLRRSQVLTWFAKHPRCLIGIEACGTANHWAPLAQIWAGVRAWRVRGFEPWANTAHACGVY